MRLRPAAIALATGLLLLLADRAGPLAQTSGNTVDTALVLAVDVSGSVDDNRYVLQMEGIVHVRRGLIHIRNAGALESKACGCYRIVRRLIEQIGRDPATQLAAPPLRAAAAAELGLNPPP